MTRFILLTGKIGAGKSYVAAMLRNKHYIVLDTDKVAKGRMEQDPSLYRTIVSRYGSECLQADGRLDYDYLRTKLFGKDGRSPECYAWPVAANVCDYILDKFSRTNEIVFIEAAPTRQIGLVCEWLGIQEAIVVQADERLRKTRLKESRRMSGYDIRKVDNLQDIGFLDECPKCNGDNTYIPKLKKYYLNNSGTPDKINGCLMDIISDKIQPKVLERQNLFQRYLRNSPDYCQNNAMCYAFFNLGGCDNCPFPCENQDRHYKKLNAKFRGKPME